MKNLMVDLETLGTRPGCVVLSIGAVWFDHTGLGEPFHTVISRDSCKEHGLFEDEDTLAWWARQSEQAKATLNEATGGGVLLPRALQDFQDFVKQQTSVKVWGNGADFDNPILSAAYHAAGMKQAWTAYNGRCYRTLKNLFPDVKMERGGIHHNALDDAISQAKHAVAILQHAKLEA